MRKIVLMEDDSNFINSVEFEMSTFSQPAEKVEDVGELSYHEFIDVVAYDVDVFSYYPDKDDFIIKNTSDLFLSLFRGDIGLVKGRLFSEVFPVLKNVGVLDFLKKINEDKQIRYFKTQYWGDGNLLASFRHALINYKGDIFLITRAGDISNTIIQQEEDLFSKSLQGLMIVQDGKMVRVNESFANSCGYSIEEVINWDALDFEIFEMNNELITNVRPELVRNIFNKLINRKILMYDGYIKQPTKSGGYVWFKTHAVPTYYNKRPAVQISAIDVTDKFKMELVNARFKQALDLVQGASKIAFVYWNKTDKFQWTDEIYNIIEMDKSDCSSEINIVEHFVLKEDKSHLLQLSKKAFEERGNFETIVRIDTKSGIKHLNIYWDYKDDGSGDYGSVGYVQDVSESVSREFELEKALVEKDFLIKEVNHRVKNNLQIILSLLNLDLRRNSHNLEKAIQSTQNRIKAMAFIHEKTYESADLDHVDLKEYIETEADSLIQFYGAEDKITFNSDLQEMELSMEIVTPLGLAINEVIINIIKYAFPDGGKGNFNISLKEENNIVTLIIGDDGVGLPEDVDIYNSPSLGLSIINSLVSQIDGTFKKLDSEKGTVFEIQFKKS